MLGRKLNVKTEDGIEPPRYAHEGDAGLDLRISREVTLGPGGRELVGTGVAVEIPPGCVGLVFPRSGLAAKRGITLSNAVGVIDSGYRGEIRVALLNVSDETAALDVGTRVAQMVVMPFVPCEVIAVDSLEQTERGEDGFGSTGID